jgi:hypothetical protein
MLRAGCWRVVAPTAGMYQILPGGLSGRLAKEVNRRPLFCRAGHRLGQPLGSGLSIDRLPVPLPFFSGHPKTAPIRKRQAPSGEPPEAQHQTTERVGPRSRKPYSYFQDNPCGRGEPAAKHVCRWKEGQKILRTVKTGDPHAARDPEIGRPGSTRSTAARSDPPSALPLARR